MQALTLINLAAREYQDIAFERIAKASWLAWLNDAQRNVVLVRPDANAVTAAAGYGSPRLSSPANTTRVRT